MAKIFFIGQIGLSIAKEHVSLDALLGAAVSTALATGMYLLSILQAGDGARISTPAKHFFTEYNYNRLALY